jgi:hypothetical protein
VVITANRSGLVEDEISAAQRQDGNRARTSNMTHSLCEQKPENMPAAKIKLVPLVLLVKTAKRSGFQIPSIGIHLSLSLGKFFRY